MRGGLQKVKNIPQKKYWLVFAVACVLAYAFFAHPDVIETSNHAYVLLDSISKGQFFNFYNDVMAHPYGTYLYYINNAHYNIVVYIIFAIVQLPVFIVNQLAGTYYEPLFYYLGKLVSAGFFIACAPVVHSIARQLGLGGKTAGWCALFFAFSPVAFFSSMIMGQYDSICLFFMLLGILYWLRGRMWACVLLMGVAATGKYFALFALVPLILLYEKRPLRILAYGVGSLWLLAPTTLMFWGAGGDMGSFSSVMMDRLFAAKIPAAMDVAAFPLIYAALCILAYLWRPGVARMARVGMWMCLAVFGSMFLFVGWHPQWAILLVPFLVITTFMETGRDGWFFADMMIAAGFFLYCFLVHPNQLEANLFDFGLLAQLSGEKVVLQSDITSVADYILRIPAVGALPMVLFGSAVLCHILLKIPLTIGTPASAIARSAYTPNSLLPAYLLGGFGLCMSVWLVPVCVSWLMNVGYL